MPDHERCWIIEFWVMGLCPVYIRGTKFIVYLLVLFRLRGGERKHE
jgi:hypothetical protein